MNKRLGTLLVGVCALAAIVWSTPVLAQTEVKEKPTMYSYVSNWAIPRAQWGEMQKGNPAEDKILQKALADGTIVGYGSDVNLIHSPDTETHDDWWSAMSMAGLLNVLEQFYQAGTPSSPVLVSATKHFDNLWVSRYYNWHSGAWKNIYTHVGVYKLKADAPDDAVATLAKNLVVPLFEKLLADGTIHEYEIDEQAIHSEAPGMFAIVYLAANGDALDKVNAAVRDAIKASPLSGSAFGAVTETSGHRDELLRTAATYK